MADSTGMCQEASESFAQARQRMQAQAGLQGSGPLKAVVIGGGTGAPASIRTLLDMGCETSAVVAMADDGGSTGILREEAGSLPPGDIRKCLAAMAADDDDPLTMAFKYRFAFARNHTLGNLMLSALEDATGSFPQAIDICSKLLGCRGSVYPSTLGKLRLCARAFDGTLLCGQAKASHSNTALREVWLESDTPIRGYEPACQAIREANLIVFGPGSLFTSIIPNLLVPGVVEAIRQSRAYTVFVCSLADIQGETWGLSALEHYRALCRHGAADLVDFMLVHDTGSVDEKGSLDRMIEALDPLVGSSEALGSKGAAQGIRRVKYDQEQIDAIQAGGTVVLLRRLVDPIHPTWHDHELLRSAFEDVLRLAADRAQEL